MKPRPYQTECIDKIIDCFKADQSCVLIQAPTGSGKSYIFSRLSEICIDNWKIKILIVVHRKILIKQTLDSLNDVGLTGDDVTVMMVQTAVRRDLSGYNLVIIDEVHRLPPKNVESSYRKVIEMINHDRLRLLGVTATPYRLRQGWLYNGKNPWFDQIDFSVTRFQRNT